MLSEAIAVLTPILMLALILVTASFFGTVLAVYFLSLVAERQQRNANDHAHRE